MLNSVNLRWVAHIECGREGIDWARLEDLCANLAKKSSMHPTLLWTFDYNFSATGRDLFIYADTEARVLRWVRWIEKQIGWLDYHVYKEVA